MGKIKKHKKLIIIFAIVLVIAVVAGVFLTRPKKSSTTAKTQYTKLSKMELTSNISTSGNIESQDIKKIYSTSNDKIKEVIADLGDYVSTGQVLATIDISDTQTNNEKAYKTAQNSLSSSELSLSKAKKNYEKNKLLYDQGAVSKEDLENSESDLQSAQLSYDKALSSLQDAQKDIDETNADAYIRSTISGTVTAVYAKEGTSANGLMFVVEDSNNLMVTTYVEEYDYPQVEEGQPVQVRTDATGDTVLNGTVVKVSPAAVKTSSGDTDTSSSVTFETRIMINDHNEAVKIGMNARLSIITQQKKDVYAVPYNSITTNNKKQNVVYTVVDKDGKKVISEVVVETGMETIYTQRCRVRV